MKDDNTSLWFEIRCSVCGASKYKYVIGFLPLMRFKSTNRFCEKCGGDMMDYTRIPSKRTLFNRKGSIEIFEEEMVDFRLS